MSGDKDKTHLNALDRRVSDHDIRLTEVKRDYTEVTHSIQELLNRVNNGLSPSVNRVKDDNEQIKLTMLEVSHTMKDELKEMRGVVRESAEHTRLMVENFEKHQLGPVVREVGFIKKTFIYGLVGALIIFIGQRAIGHFWDKIFKNDIPSIYAPKND